MPQENNRVTLNMDVKDQHRLPVANVNFIDHHNGIAMRDHAFKTGMAMYEALGATRVLPTPPYPSTHNLGTNRMSANAADGVVNKTGKARMTCRTYSFLTDRSSPRVLRKIRRSPSWRWPSVRPNTSPPRCCAATSDRPASRDPIA
jgi:hypothetical protein